MNDSPKAQSSDQPGSVTSARKKDIKEEEEEKGEEEEEEVNPEKKTFDCKLAQLQENVKKVENEATYWHIGWRSALCKCKRCLVSRLRMVVVYRTPFFQGAGLVHVWLCKVSLRDKVIFFACVS